MKNTLKFFVPIFGLWAIAYSQTNSLPPLPAHSPTPSQWIDGGGDLSLIGIDTNAPAPPNPPIIAPQFPPPIPTYTLIVESTESLTGTNWTTVLKVPGISAKTKARYFRTRVVFE